MKASNRIGKQLISALLATTLAFSSLPLQTHTAVAGGPALLVEKAIDQIDDARFERIEQLEAYLAKLAKADPSGTAQAALDKYNKLIDPTGNLAKLSAKDRFKTLTKIVVGVMLEVHQEFGSNPVNAVTDVLVNSPDLVCGITIIQLRSRVLNLLVRAPGALEHAQRLLDEMNDFINTCRKIGVLGFEIKKGEEADVKAVLKRQVEVDPLVKFVKSLKGLDKKCYQLILVRTARYEEFAAGRLDGKDLVAGEDLIKLEIQIQNLRAELLKSSDRPPSSLKKTIESLKQTQSSRKVEGLAPDPGLDASIKKYEAQLEFVENLDKYSKRLRKLEETYAIQFVKLEALYKDVLKAIKLCGDKFKVFSKSMEARHQQDVDLINRLLTEFWRNRFRFALERAAKAKDQQASVLRRPASFKTAIREKDVCVATKYTVTTGEGMEILKTSLLAGPLTEIGERPVGGDGRLFPEAITETEVVTQEEGEEEIMVMVTPIPGSTSGETEVVVLPSPNEATSEKPVSQAPEEPPTVEIKPEEVKPTVSGEPQIEVVETPQSSPPAPPPEAPLQIPTTEPTPDLDYGLVKASAQVVELAMSGGAAGAGQAIEGAQIKLLADAPPLPGEEVEFVTAASDLPEDIFEDSAFFTDDVESDISDSDGGVELAFVSSTVERIALDGSKTTILGLERSPFNDAFDQGFLQLQVLIDAYEYIWWGGARVPTQSSSKNDPDKNTEDENEDPDELGDSDLDLDGKTRFPAPLDDSEDPGELGDGDLDLDGKTKFPSTPNSSRSADASPTNDKPDDFGERKPASPINGPLTTDDIKKIAEAIRKGTLPPRGGSSKNVSYLDIKPTDVSSSGSDEPSVLQIELPASSKRPPIVLGFANLLEFGAFFGLTEEQILTGDFDANSLPDKIQSLGPPTRYFNVGDQIVAVFEGYQEAFSEYSKFLETNSHVAFVEEDPCREKQENADPHFSGSGLWGQAFDNQWAIKRVGFTGEPADAWDIAGTELKPVTVAVIDTGVDWFHPDLPRSALWKNSKEVPGNGVDDDDNGYIDDVIGWNFIDNDRKPWDYDGHGTFIAGVISAARNNNIGIAGINPKARIMPIKALDEFGNGHSTMIAEAIAYAVDNGANIINLSLGGDKLTSVEKLAVEYAREKNVLVIAASGNKGASVADYSPAGLTGVVTVSATDRKDEFARFSNWGPAVDIAAPGVDVLSLRARNTDLLADIPDVEYNRGAAIVGEDRAYLRASGTSFAAPIVAGTAALIMSAKPNLTAEQVNRMLVNSAADIETRGFDNFTGNGLLDAAAALQANPEFFITSRLDSVKVVRLKNNRQAIRVLGTTNANEFAGTQILLGRGAEPKKWARLKKQFNEPVIDGSLAILPASALRGAKTWIIRLITEHKSGKKRETRFKLSLG